MTNSTSADALLHYVNRIEELEEEKAGVADHIKVVFADLKANGFDPKVVRALIKERKIPKADLAEFKEMMDMYRAALGMLPEIPMPDGATVSVTLAKERPRNKLDDYVDSVADVLTGVSPAEHVDPATGEIIEETWEQPARRAAGRRKSAA